MDKRPKLGFMSSLMRTSQEAEIKLISVYDLIPHPDNFYQISDIESLEDAIELRGGIKENLIVTPVDDGKYKVISGHRRRQALLNLLSRGVSINEIVPCNVETFKSNAEEQIALIIANSATRRLTEWEKIEQYKRLKEPLAEYYKSHQIPGRMREFISDTLGISTGKIAKTENIANNLVDEYKEELKSEKINFSTAAELASLPSEQQKEVYQEVHKTKGITNIKDVKEKKETIALKKVSFEKIEAAKYLKEVIEKKTEMLTCRLETEKNQCEQIVIKEKLNYCKKYLKLVEKDLFDMTGNNMFKN